MRKKLHTKDLDSRAVILFDHPLNLVGQQVHFATRLVAERTLDIDDLLVIKARGLKCIPCRHAPL